MGLEGWKAAVFIICKNRGATHVGRLSTFAHQASGYCRAAARDDRGGGRRWRGRARLRCGLVSRPPGAPARSAPFRTSGRGCHPRPPRRRRFLRRSRRSRPCRSRPRRGRRSRPRHCRTRTLRWCTTDRWGTRHMHRAPCTGPRSSTCHRDSRPRRGDLAGAQEATTHLVAPSQERPSHEAQPAKHLPSLHTWRAGRTDTLAEVHAGVRDARLPVRANDAVARGDAPLLRGRPGLRRSRRPRTSGRGRGPWQRRR